MTNFERYETQIGSSNNPQDRLLFTFVSKGEQDIDKVVLFQRLPNSITIPNEGVKSIFNLGFGDYTTDANDINDLANSNNGDMRIVFNTVLNTIPLFFHQYPDCCLFVKGSDDRRIKVYCNHVSKNIATYSAQYSFYGLDSSNNKFEPFIAHKEYNGVLFYQ